MTDEDFKDFLMKMYDALSDVYNGVLILKETTRREDDILNTYDPRQNMYIRTREENLQFFEEADFEIVKVHETLYYDINDPDMS